MNLGGPAAARFSDGLGTVFLRAGAVRMNLDHRTIQRDRFDFDANDLRALPFLEYTIKHTLLGPAIHPRIDRVPITETLWQAAPLAAMLGNVKDRVQHLQVRHANVAALLRQAMYDPLKLLFRDFHHSSIRPDVDSVNTP